ncbi:hypothetical protein F5Y19DRAFT_481413 [Xylariaceae sp. FL1651]|nr:hypothetical protein F5Y19DRAFT_481413 [Xylariaceae sp. FL1651]
MRSQLILEWVLTFVVAGSTATAVNVSSDAIADTTATFSAWKSKQCPGTPDYNSVTLSYRQCLTFSNAPIDGVKSITTVTNSGLPGTDPWVFSLYSAPGCTAATRFIDVNVHGSGCFNENTLTGNGFLSVKFQHSDDV